MGTPGWEAAVSVSLDEIAAGGPEAPETMDLGIRCNPAPLCGSPLNSGLSKDFGHLGAPYTFILLPPHNEKAIHRHCKMFRQFKKM